MKSEISQTARIKSHRLGAIFVEKCIINCVQRFDTLNLAIGLRFAKTVHETKIEEIIVRQINFSLLQSGLNSLKPAPPIFHWVLFFPAKSSSVRWA